MAESRYDSAMNSGVRPTHCSNCRGVLIDKSIMHTVPVGDEMFEIENVPALVCLDCGESWLDQATLETIERIVSENRHV